MAELGSKGLELWKAGKLDVDHFNQTGEIKTASQVANIILKE